MQRSGAMVVQSVTLSVLHALEPRVGLLLPFFIRDLDMANDYDIDATELLETYG